MKINKKEILASLQKDFESAKTLRKMIDADVFRRRDVYKGNPYGNEEPGKSKIVPRIAKRQEEWAHASLKEPFVSTPDLVRMVPITAEDVPAAKQNEILLNYQFCRDFDRYNFITKALKVLEVDATVFVQVGWEYEEEIVEEEVETVVYDDTGSPRIERVINEVVKVKKNRPTAKVCRTEDIFVDPTCQDVLDNAQFVIYRYESDLTTLRKDGRYKNLDKLKNVSAYNDSDYYPIDKTNFRFEDEPRKKFIVYEYWGNYDIDGDGIVEPIICTWVEDVIIRLEENPFPDKKAPFISCAASHVPYQIYGENNIDLIEDQQKVITAVTRGIINNMAASTNGQIGIRKGALDEVQKRRFFKGQNFEFNGTPNDFWQGSYNPIPTSAFNMLQMMNADVESLTGEQGFAGGITGKSLGGSATAARGVMNATATRRLDKIRNIAENLIKPLIRKWMTYNAEFLDEETVVRVTNEQFVPIRRDDLDGNIDISIQISTPEDDNAKKSELSFMLQTMGNTLPFPMTQKILAEIARLNRMPDLEKDILSFKPEPDPLQEELAALEREKIKAQIAKTKAEIREIYSRSVENKEGDLAEKQAKARLLQAQAKLAESKSDMEDLKFIKVESQADEMFQLEKKKLELEHKERLARLKEEYNQLSIDKQVGAGDSNIGVKQY